MRFLLFLIFTGIFVVLADEHPRYTAAKLTDQLKNILESGGNAEVSQLFTDDVIVEECGETGSLEYLEKKFKTLIPELSEVSLTVKFAYPIPYTNNSIQFSVDQVLMFKDAQKSENELVIFAKPEDENLEVYKIFEIRKTPCN